MTSGSCGLSRKTIPQFVTACIGGVRVCSSVVRVRTMVGWFGRVTSCLRCITIAVREGAHDNSPGCRSASASFSSAQWWVEGPSSQSVHVGGGADACGEEHKLHAVALASLTLVHLPQAHDVAALMGSATVAATVATARVPPASFTSSRSPNALSASPKFDPASSVQWPSVGRVAGLRGDRRDRV